MTRADGRPAPGFAFITSDNRIVGTAQVEAATTNLTVTATDSSGASTSDSFAISVTALKEKLFKGASNKDNTLKGTSQNDKGSLGSGNDRYRAGDGDDLIIGDNGNTRTSRKGGNDVINGGADQDTLLGGGGNDVLRGGSGFDVLFGQRGKDKLNGGSGQDVLYGGLDRDTLTVGMARISSFSPIFRRGTGSPIST